MHNFTPVQLRAIKTARDKGQTWNAIGKRYGITGQGLRRYMIRLEGQLILPAPKQCPYCEKEFTPFRGDAAHCGSPDCRQDHFKARKREYYNRRNKMRRELTQEEKPPQPNQKQVKVKCLGNHCGGQEFISPATIDHGRILPLHHICPICREWNHNSNGMADWCKVSTYGGSR